MKYRILHDNRKVTGVAVDGDGIILKPSTVPYIVTDDLEDVHADLLGRGINCVYLEDYMGLDPTLLNSFHTKDLKDWNGLQRKADLVMFNIRIQYRHFVLIYKVKHYLNGEYRRDLQPDHIVKLRADNTTLFPEYGNIGEWDLYVMAFQNGNINLKLQLDIQVSQRELEERFNKEYEY